MAKKKGPQPQKKHYVIEEKKDEFIIQEHIVVDDRQSTLLVKSSVKEDKKGQFDINLKLTTVQVSRDEETFRATLKNITEMLFAAGMECNRRRDEILAGLEEGDPDQINMFKDKSQPEAAK